MKKNFKRTLAKVMAVALTVSLVGTAADADAAKKVKLSAKSITVTKGKSKKVTIKNVKAKKVKKLTVKTSKKKIATVKKSGKTAFKVTGKKVGSAKITATLKIKGKKKATKLTLKVKVKKAAKKPATTTPATAAPQESATPAPQESATPEPTVTPEPTATPEPIVWPEVYDFALTADMMPGWVTNGDDASTPGSEYGTVVFNEDGTVSFSTEPTEAEKTGSVYNNGVAFYITDAKDKVDISGYTYIAFTVATTAEFKLMTWSGGSDPESFWDKRDTWGSQAAVVDNGDGTKTIYYEIPTAFASDGTKARAAGFTLKAADPNEVVEGDAEPSYVAQTATLYSIKLLDEIQAAPPAATQSPFSEGVQIDLNDAFLADMSDAAATAAKDEDGYAATKIAFSGNYQRAFFSLPEDVDAAEIAKIEIYGEAPAQMSASLFQNDFSTSADSWWTLAKAETYPFYGGSGTRDEQGGLIERGRELSVLTVPAGAIEGNGGFISVGSNAVPAVVEDAETDEEMAAAWATCNYYIYGINIVLKGETPETPEVETPEVETPGAETETPETPEVPEVETPDAETEDVEEEVAEPVVYEVDKEITYTGEVAQYAGNLGANLDEAITVKDTDTVSVLVEIKDAEGNASEVTMQIALCTSTMDYYGSRTLEAFPFADGDELDMTAVDGAEIDGTAEIVAVYTNNMDAVAEGETAVLTIKTITVTPAE